MYTKPPEWSGKYVGIPFEERGRSLKGCDCWGIIYLILKERFNIEVPSYNNEYTTIKEWQRLMQLIVKYEQENYWNKVDNPKEGDLVLLRTRGLPIHIGIVSDPFWFLHIDEGADSNQERMEDPAWKFNRIGYWRHVDLLNAT